LNFSVAWVEGELVCFEARSISGRLENPCGVRFTLSNKHTYVLEGCGGDVGMWLMNGDGTFNSNCKHAGNAKEDCAITKEFICG
jgi:hypothetical protein